MEYFWTSARCMVDNFIVGTMSILVRCTLEVRAPVVHYPYGPFYLGGIQTKFENQCKYTILMTDQLILKKKTVFVRPL